MIGFYLIFNKKSINFCDYPKIFYSNSKAIKEFHENKKIWEFIEGKKKTRITSCSTCQKEKRIKKPI